MEDDGGVGRVMAIAPPGVVAVVLAVTVGGSPPILVLTEVSPQCCDR